MRWSTGIVLVVDREDDVLRILRTALQSSDYAVLHASSEQEAIAFLERLRSKIELAVIDLELPDFSGWDLIGRLTLHDRKPVKIIATTSIYPESVLEKIKEIGVDAIVRKPIPYDDWRTTLEVVMAEK